MANSSATMTVSGALQAAAEHLGAGRLDDAERLYDAVLAAQPDHAEALHRRGVLAFQRGAFDHAADLVRRAIALDNAAPDLRNRLGNILLRQDDCQGAIECYRKSLTLDPGNPVVQINLGIALYGAGSRAEAADSLSDGVERMPDHAQARAALGQIALDEGDDDAAVVQLRAAAYLDPRFAYGASCVLGDDLAAYTAPEAIDEMLSVAPALEGEMPAADRPGPVVAASCDHRYFRKFAGSLARSLDANSPGHDLHLHVFNPEPGFDAELASLRSSLPDTALTISRERLAGADPVYFSNMRLVRLYQIISACRRTLISLDADSLVRGALGGIDADLAGAEIAITMRSDKAEVGQKMLATTIVLRDTSAVRDYLLRVSCYVLNCFHEERLAWYLDQSVLYLVHRMMQQSGAAPSLATLPETYADSALTPGSAIWAAKGDRKTAPAFIAEAARYAIPLTQRQAPGRRAM